MRVGRDLTIVRATAGVCALLTLIVPPEAVRLVAAIPLALLLPGYAITAAVFATAPLDRSRTLLLSVGLSLTTLATGGLLLNFVPGGIREGSWAALLFAVVVAGCAIAARRRPGPGPRLLVAVPKLRAAEAAMLPAAVLCVVAAAVLSSTPLSAKHAVGYTELWMLPENRAGGAGVQVGVASAETGSLAYRLEVRQQGRPLVSSRLVLGPGQQSVRFVGVRGPRPGGAVRFTARLYREDEPGVIYRRVSGWVRGA